MKLRFVSILGKVYTKTFASNSTVQEACDFLAKKVDIPQSIIFLVRPKHFYYSSNEKIETVFNENRKYVIFVRLDRNYSDNNSQFQKRLPKSDIDSISNFQQIRSINSEATSIYSKYSSVLKNTPGDLQERINEVAQLGYDVKDCEEALRNSEFNVGIAIQMLVSSHSENNSNLNYIENLSLYSDDDFDISSDLEFETNPVNNIIHNSFSDISFSSLSSSDDFDVIDDNDTAVVAKNDVDVTVAEKEKNSPNNSNQIKIFRRQNIPESIKKQFHYHLTLRRKPPSKFKKIKREGNS